MKKPILPPTYFIISLLLILAGHFFLPLMKIVPTPYNFLGLALILFGIILNLWTDSIFKKKRTTVKPHENPSFFIAKGPFKLSRHPMYLGMAFILLGSAVFLGSLTAFVFPIIFIIIIENKFISLEEKNLENKFSQEYLDYKEKVRRWI